MNGTRAAQIACIVVLGVFAAFGLFGAIVKRDPVGVVMAGVSASLLCVFLIDYAREGGES